jgi:hypothetical protein
MAVIARTSHNTAETRFVSAAAGRRLRASRSAKEGAQHFDLIVFVRPGHKRTAKSPYLRGFSSKRLGHGFGPRVHFLASDQTTPPAYLQALPEAGATGLEPATSGVTGRRSNQLNYAPEGGAL